MNRINQLFSNNPRNLLSIYFCAGSPVSYTHLTLPTKA